MSNKTARITEFKRKGDDLSYKIAVQNGIRELFLAAVPETNLVCQNAFQGHGQAVPDCPAQCQSLLRKIRTVLEEENFLGSVVSQTVFLAEIGKKQLLRRELAEFYGSDLPASTYVPQAPCGGGQLAIELHAVASDGTAPLEIRRSGDRATRVRYDGLDWLMLGNIVPGESPVGSYERSKSAFAELDAELQKQNFQVEQLLRTWLYQGHLVLPEGDTQRYKELNRARTDFFESRNFLAPLLPKHYQGPIVYPASTGIGADDVDLSVGGIALTTQRKDVFAVPLENPNQTPAFDYGAVYSPQSPKFSRAMLLKSGEAVRIFVSGTAGITDSESRYDDDPEMQTRLTLENIEALVSGSNMRRHGIDGFETGLSDFLSLRVYIKRPADAEAVRALCEARCPNVPILYTVADVCRPELLVEIEGIAAPRAR